MENREYTLQVIDIDIANGTAAGFQTSNQKFNQGYDRLDGVALVEKENGGNAAQYEVGFDFPSQNVTIRAAHHSLYEFTPTTPADARFNRLNTVAAGAEFSVNTRLLAAATADLKYQLILKLSKPKVENC